MDLNAYELIKDRKSHLPEHRIKLYVYQLCKALYHLHRNGIFHRDVKPENILIKGDIVKLADFGSCRSIYSHQPYTEYISTRWYRAPECLLTDGFYSYKMDIWSAGCVLFELVTLHPLFPGTNELDQISRIHNVLGTPSDEVLDKFRIHQSRSMSFNFPKKSGTGISSYLRHTSKGCADLILKMCSYDPDDRFSTKQSLRHPYFSELREAEIRAIKARQDHAISGMSSIRGSALVGSISGRQQLFGKLIPTVKEDGGEAATESKQQGGLSKQLTLPDLVPKAPVAEKKSKDPLGLPKVTATSTLPGILHHQKIRGHQVPSSKIHKPHHKAPKPHFLQPLNQKNSRPRM
jgi:renal tumor antigen